MLGNRYSQHSFAQIPDVRIGRSQFDRSFTIKDTIQFDDLTPVYVDEVIPGDTHNVTVNMFARLATQIVPIMDNMYVDFFFFFVPNRLVWTNWEKFNGAQDNPDDTTDFIIPQLTTTGSSASVGSIYDKFGIPTDVTGVPIKNVLPLRCYKKIWNDWFRDQNMQDSLVISTDDGPDAFNEYTILKRGKRHDYFTSCLPWPQKGDAVSLPIGTTAPILASGPINVDSSSQQIQMTTTGAGNNWTNTQMQTLIVSGFATVGNPSVNMTSAGGKAVVFGDSTGLEVREANLEASLTADLSAATAVTVNQLRQAIMIQSLLELDARGGTRYVEILRAHFGVISPDFRLQRAEYLGGGSVKINSHPVAQTAPTSGSDPQAQLAAFATAMASDRNNIGFTKSFVEHGYIIGLACPRADITYQQGLNRMWSRSTRYDFFWPKLQELGEQAVLNQELYVQGSAAPSDDTAVFGYQERYAEYRYKPSEIHGAFRSTYATSLDFWHLAEEFESLPSLDSSFIEQATPIERAIAIETEPHLLMDVYYRVKSARPMLTYSVPATLGRF